MPSMDMHTTLSPVEFRNEAHLRLSLPLLGTPTHCYGCKNLWKVTHALSCPFEKIITVRHNEAHNEIMETCCKAFIPSRVHDEPIVNLVRVMGGCGGHTTAAGAQKRKMKGRAVPSLSVVVKLSRGKHRRQNRQQLKATGGNVEAGAKEACPEPEQPRRQNALDSDR